MNQNDDFVSLHNFNALGLFTVTHLNTCNTCKEPARHAIITHLFFSYTESCIHNFTKKSSLIVETQHLKQNLWKVKS